MSNFLKWMVDSADAVHTGKEAHNAWFIWQKRLPASAAWSRRGPLPNPIVMPSISCYDIHLHRLLPLLLLLIVCLQEHKLLLPVAMASPDHKVTYPPSERGSRRYALPALLRRLWLPHAVCLRADAREFVRGAARRLRDFGLPLFLHQPKQGLP
ncbi:hypothetical protein MA16_Dca012327 [Dendrobium catenatum]|uniref:Uncharacterized protein n=1 Tax=Dendrobium catenatum TaxID=906689 RepID=A0A2I0WRE5_9ASPA|nr:hypothetical protein MA16_Dca012327 [Dendrobium catenatum]